MIFHLYIIGLTLVLTTAYPMKPQNEENDAKSPTYSLHRVEIGLVPAQLVYIPIEDNPEDKINEASKPLNIKKRETEDDLEVAAAKYSSRKTRYNLGGYQSPFNNADYFPTVV